MPAKKGAAKPARKKPVERAWTEVDDFYLTSKAGAVPVAEIAEKLGRGPAQIEARLVELGVDLAKLAADKRLASFQLQGERGVVAGALGLSPGEAAKPMPAAPVGATRNAGAVVPLLPRV